MNLGKFISLLLLSLLLVLMADTSLAEDEDVIILKEGGMYKGTIISDRGGNVKIKVRGKTITVKKKDIRKIIAKPKPAAEYKTKAKETSKKDVEGNYTLAMWCKQNGLKKEMKKHLKFVLKLDPNHIGARLESGYGFYNEEWLSVADLEKQGLVFYNNKWINKKEMEEAEKELRSKRLAGIEDYGAECDTQLEEYLKPLDYTSRTLKVKGNFIYNRFERDKTRLYIVREPLFSPLGLPAIGQEVLKELNAVDADPLKTLEFLGDRSGLDIELGEDIDLAWEPKTSSGNNLYAALISLSEAAGTPYIDENRKIIKARADRVPDTYRDGIADLVNSFSRAVLIRKKAFEEVVLDDFKKIIEREHFGDNDRMLDTLDFTKEAVFLESYSYLAESARVMVKALFDFKKFVKDNKLKEGVARREYILDVDTPWGSIIIGGKGDNYFEKSAAIVIDLGGNDTYDGRFGSSTCSITGGIGVSLDLGGNDKYICELNDSFGAGHFGLGLSFDLDGDDTYSAMDYSLGSSFFGIGIVYDGGGKDKYECGSHGMGEGFFGFGVLLDKSGNDSYGMSKYGQGYGGTYGVGLLLDSEGDDQYRAGTGSVSDAMNEDAEACFAQGAARGYMKRDEEGENVKTTIVSGGWGVLADLGGNDKYNGDSFSQGTGRWSGLGMLLDHWGDDIYKAKRNSQGASAFISTGLLMDCLGNDEYICKEFGQGCAVQLSVAALVDYYGDDKYRADDKSLGFVYALNGFAILFDSNGKDSYKGGSASFGFYENPNDDTQDGVKTLGFFMDLGGEDVYSGRKGLENGKEWADSVKSGVGVDKTP